MLATAGIAAAEQIDPSYSPGSANVHPYNTHSFFRPTQVRPARRHLHRFSRLCEAHAAVTNIDIQTEIVERQDTRMNSPHISLRVAMQAKNTDAPVDTE